MRSETVLSLMDEVPESATNEEALAWIKRMRRIVSRWRHLPVAAQVSLSEEEKRRIHAQLDEMEHAVRLEMLSLKGA